MKTRIMYIESKANGLTGPARIGRVSFSKTGATLYYQGKAFKANYFEVENGDSYWISGPKKNGQDQLYPTNVPVEVDADVHNEYWSEIRGRPSKSLL
jgi:hypothetical protein